MKNLLFTQQRNRLIEEYIKQAGVTDKKVLRAMAAVPRHEFVPDEYKDRAYMDIPLPIGEGQTISQPSLVAQMTQLLALTGRETVLEIGTGSGYQTAILSLLSKKVVTIERICTLAEKAKRLFKRLGYTNIHVICGDGSLGFPREAPYDAIIVTAGATQVPSPLVDQLKEGGRIVIPVGSDKNKVLLAGTKKNGKLIMQEIEPVQFVPLIGKYA